jgi:hypothetical protein
VEQEHSVHEAKTILVASDSTLFILFQVQVVYVHAAVQRV